MLTHMRYRYTILGKLHFDAEISELQITVPQNQVCDSVIVEIIPSKNEVVASYSIEVSEQMREFLQTGRRKVSPALYDELRMMGTNASSATRRVLDLVKYGLGYIDLDERLVSLKGAEWSTDEIDWRVLPRRWTMTLDTYSSHPLNPNTVSTIQRCIENGFEPFLALRHLHKARKENVPRYKWIDATIAAELAIKEFLIRLKPDIAALLLEMPSPPLHKLYGTVLESLGFSRSPKVSQIASGVQIRNKLVHRPEEVEITLEKANAYVRDVEIAIYHLLVLLYPDDPDVAYFYRTATLDDD